MATVLSKGLGLALLQGQDARSTLLHWAASPPWMKHPAEA